MNRVINIDSWDEPPPVQIHPITIQSKTPEETRSVQRRAFWITWQLFRSR